MQSKDCPSNRRFTVFQNMNALLLDLFCFLIGLITSRSSRNEPMLHPLPHPQGNHRPVGMHQRPKTNKNAFLFSLFCFLIGLITSLCLRNEPGHPPPTPFPREKQRKDLREWQKSILSFLNEWNINLNFDNAPESRVNGIERNGFFRMAELCSFGKVFGLFGYLE